MPGKGKMANGYLWTALLAFAVIFAVVVYQWRLLDASRKKVLEPVTIANTSYVGTCAVLVAKEQGYFEDEGLLVTIRPYTTGKAAVDAMLSGQADLGTSAELPIVFAAMNAQPAMVVATIAGAEKDYGIVGRKDKGFLTPATIKGKRIGTTLGTSAHFAFDAFLNRQKLSTKDVTMLNFKPEQLADAMMKGDIDVASTWEPYLSGLHERLGDNASVFSTEDVYDSLYSLSGTKDYVLSHAETIKKVLRALIRGGEYCKNAPDKSSEAIAKHINIDMTRLKQVWSSYRFRIVLDQDLLLALEDQTRWAIKNKLIKHGEMPNYMNFVYIDGLQAVSPADVTLIH